MKLFGITFAAAKNLIFLPVLIFAIICLVWRYVKTKKVVRELAGSSRVSTLFKHFSRTRNIIKIILLSIGFTSLFLGLLRPQWDKKEEVVAQKGRDLFIAIDISRSMLAQDYKPNRLAFAKEKIKKLVSNLKSERVSLVIFSGSTVVQCPLTADMSAFFMFLDQLDVETISSGTTALDQPIKQVLQMLRDKKNKKTKLLVLFTDGEDFSSNLAGIREKAAKEGLKIFTMGVGTPEGAPIPLITKEGKRQGHIKDKSGNAVISRLNEGILSSLAIETGGEYIRLTESDNDLRRLISLVEKFEKEKFEDKKLPALQERYNYFLLVSLVCFSIEWIL
ncbi:VWA domain-containing protein [Candidatus Dependentiae bacterium]